MPRWLTLIGVAVLAAAATFLALSWLLSEPDRITVATWEGAYGRSQAVALFRPFTEETGTAVRGVEYDGGIDEIVEQAASGDVAWDVIDLELPDAERACTEGLLEPLSIAGLAPGVDGTPAAQDFVPGALGPCWVGTMVYSQIVAYDPARLPVAPASLGDFFDLKRFPGARGLRGTGPKYNLELALLADGVAPSDIYIELSREEGIARAFAKLDTIKPSIVWWRKSGEPIDLVSRGEVAMTTALNGRVFDAAIVAKRSIAALWDRQLYEFDAFAVPKGAPHREDAFAFIRFATAPERLATQARFVPFGPARHSALPLVGAHAELDIEMMPHLPTAKANFANALLVDAAWWSVNRETLTARWNAWREN